ncbi:MAG: 50S ribosomal protein L20 [Xanthomonadaceae bacterium]|nr:50S ribosomal protein L20 [Rhodospirillaceae bacterium]NIA17908.1 50S ribosomal protein L20 [Xanthomonadaceae bacterium]
MPRIKRGTTHVQKRKKILTKTKGFKWGRKNLIKLAKTAATKAGAHSYGDRKKKKRDFRSLWQIKINAGVRKYGINYSTFIKQLKNNKIGIDRKILADLAENNQNIFHKIIEKIK